MRPIIEKTKEIDKIKIYLSLFKLQKSYLLLISDQENRGCLSLIRKTEESEM